MITSRSALKFDLCTEAVRKHKIDEVGDPLQVIAQHIDFATLAALVAAPGLSRTACSTKRRQASL